MTAGKAREIVLEYVRFNRIYSDEDFTEALKLAVESFDRLLLVRAETGLLGPGLLPGETIDE